MRIKATIKDSPCASGAVWVAVIACFDASATLAEACSVCFGDPESPMTQGAVAGVVVLAAIVYGVLFGFAGITVFWIVRARRRAFSIDSDQQTPPDLLTS